MNKNVIMIILIVALSIAGFVASVGALEIWKQVRHLDEIQSELKRRETQIIKDEKRKYDEIVAENIARGVYEKAGNECITLGGKFEYFFEYLSGSSKCIVENTLNGYPAKTTYLFLDGKWIPQKTSYGKKGGE